MLNLGKVKPGSTIYIPFDTFDGGTGASITMSGLAVTDIEVYKGSSMTQRASDNGYTLLDTDGIDIDGLTGIHGFSIDLADNSTAGFWAAGSRYTVVVSTITVDAQTVSFIAAVFTIGTDGAMLDTTIASLSSQTSFTLTDGPAEDDALNGCVVYIHDVASAVQGGFAVIADYTGSTKTVTLTAGATFTAAATDNISILPPANTRWLGATAQTGNDVGADVDAILVDTATTLQAELDGIQADTEDIQARLPAALVGGRIDATVDGTGMEAAAAAVIVDAWEAQSQADPTGFHVNVMEVGGTAQTANDNGADINAILADTNELQTDWVNGGRLDLIIDAILVDTAAIGAAGAGLTAVPWNAAWDAEVQSEVADALAASGLDKLVILQGTADSGTSTTMVDAALTQADADWWKGAMILFTSGTIAGQARIITDFNASTDTITFSPATTAAVSTQTYVILPWISVWDDTLAEHLGSGSAGEGLNSASSAGDPWGTALPGAYGAGTAGNILGNRLLGTISAGTHSPQSGDAFSRIGAAGASLSAIPWNASWDTEVQSEAADALVAIGMDHLVSASVTGSEVADNSIFARLVSASATADWDTFNQQTDSMQAISADLLTAASLVSGTSDSGSTTTMVDAARTEADNDYWKGAWIVFTSGNIAGQVRQITGFTASTDTITFAPATTQAVGTNTYDIIVGARVDVGLWAGSAPSALISGRVDSNVQASASGLTVNITGNLSGTVGSVTGAVGSVTGNVGGNVVGSVASVTGAVGSVTGAVGSVTADVTLAASSIDDIWDEAISGHLTAGTTGLALNSASSAGDPWSTSLPGAYGAGTAGNILGNRLVGTIATGTHNPQSGDAYARIGSNGAGLSAVPWNSSWDAEVQSEVNDAIIVVGLDHLISASVAGTDVADNSIMARLVSASATADWDDFAQTTDSLQAIRDRGDSAWITATGFLDAAGTRAAVGMSSANLDSQLGTIDSNVDSVLDDTGTNGVIVATNNDKTGYSLAGDIRIKKNTAFANFPFLMVDSTDLKTPETGLTVTAQRVIDGGSLASCANSVVEISNGLYRINLDASDLNGDAVTFRFTASGAADRIITVFTQTD